MENISKPVCVTVNGVVYNRTVSTAMTLLDFIRDELKLKGTKRSCDNGECGACSVIMDDELVYSCIHEALMDEGAIQCGYCTPGMVLAIKKLLDEHPDPTESEIKYGLAGNICRCTGYVSIENAVKKAAAVLRGE